MFFQEQTEGLFSTELGNASEVLDPEALENLGSLQLAFTRTKRALNFIVHQGRMHGRAFCWQRWNLLLWGRRLSEQV